MYMSSKQVQHRLAPFYKLCRALVLWIEEPGNVLAALGFALALSVLLGSSSGRDDERTVAVVGSAGMTQSDFWTLHDAALIDDLGASVESSQCAPVADDAAASDCAESAADERSPHATPILPIASLQALRWARRPGDANADIHAITAP